MNRQPSVITNTAVSFILHAVMFALLTYTIKKQSPMLIPAAYKVNLVSVGDSTGAKTSHPPVPATVRKPQVEEEEPEAQEPVAKKEPPVKKEVKKEVKEVPVPKKEVTKPVPKEVPIPKEVPVPKKEVPKPTAEVKKETEAKDEVTVEESIALLKAKKKLQQQARLRSTISLKADNSAGNSQATTQRQGKPSMFESPNGVANGVQSDDMLAQYIGLIGGLIRKRWIFPDSAKKDMEAIVFFTITKDGKVEHIKLDKSSGNTFYDRSCLSAVNKSVPLPTPPVDNMEVAIRFYP
ncbi:MAG: cell envelope integrity protein TolA [Nitrospirae bacterium]|nr:cell envelope integrity protein TolA [Nitrospirota bacterium]MBF0590789.1 cell envelope integrity protein TolA [Nitrospirota bacterium]